MAEPGGRAVERKLELPVLANDPMIGVKPLFSGRSLGEGEQARFDVILAAPDNKQLAASGLRYELLRVESRYQWYKQDGVWQFEPVKTTRRVADGTFDIAADKPAQLSLPVSYRPLPPRSLQRRSGRAEDFGRLRRRLVCGSERRHARPARARARQGGIRVGRHHDRGGDRAHRGTADGECDRRPADHHGRPRREAGREQDQSECRPRLGQRRLCGRHAAPSARRAGTADAGPRHRRAMVLHQPQGADAGARHAAAGGDASADQSAHPDQGRRSRCRRRGEGGRGRRRCRHSESHQLQAARAGGFLSRPAPSHRRGARSLRAADRRHAGHARTDPHRRRRWRRRIERQPAGAGAARALFRHRHRRPRRHGGGGIRHSGFRRHRAGDGGGLEQGQGRPCDRRRDHPRSGGGHGKPAALPADRRPLHAASRSRQCGRRGGRLQRRGARRRRFGDRRRERRRWR